MSNVFIISYINPYINIIAMLSMGTARTRDIKRFAQCSRNKQKLHFLKNSSLIHILIHLFCFSTFSQEFVQRLTSYHFLSNLYTFFYYVLIFGDFANTEVREPSAFIS